MGIEEMDVCLDKQPDCVTVYTNGDLGSSTKGTIGVIHHERLDYIDQLTDNSEPQRVEENSDSKEYEGKECTKGNSECAVVDLGNIEKQNLGNNLKEKISDAPSKGKFKSKERPVKHSPKNSPVSVRSGCTVPQPFTLATEKRASTGASPVTEGAINYDLNLSPLKDSRLRKIIGTLISRNHLRAEYKKHPEEEDSSSVASPTAVSTGTPKKKVLASPPKFQSSERAEKRKEFNSKLEKKQLALEAEKIQYEARTKEETEAAIKQLRKSLTFKATPLPSFYHDGPLPNIELRKLPATRPKSPKLGRRRSCSDAPTSVQHVKIKGAHAPDHRASLGNCKGKTFDSSGCYKKRGEAASVFKGGQILV
uniref:TPX2 C-terminal domain-containing protein n=1 Tax=Kalanchoe fedtschenkoi TaxID=63787 RepID=A0A7N1A1S5_KALFE